MEATLRDGNCKRQFLRLREMRGQTGGLTFHRGILVRKMLSDPELSYAFGGLGHDEIYSILEREVSDLFIGLGELVRMVELVPNRERWEATGLRELWKECLASTPSRARTRPARGEIDWHSRFLEERRLRIAAEKKLGVLRRRLAAAEKFLEK